MGNNKNLTEAKRRKQDEFYTQLPDIENELQHYTEHFKGKTVLCNCDDPRDSNFFKYFAFKFESLGLKKLIATCYKSQSRDLFSQGDSEKAIWLEYTGDKNGNRIPDPEEIGIHHFKGDGDFRSEECIELLKQADIVCTNPPFSLFREYVGQLMEYDKKFLIIGPMNALTYKEVFPLFRDNMIWLGYGFKNHTGFFLNGCINGLPSSVSEVAVLWYTNLDHKKRHEELILYKTYNPEEYPKFDNYDAIEVSKTVDIPIDYPGVMGVPISFMEKFCPEQFEILGNEYMLNIPKGRGYIHGKRMYGRIFIRHKKVSK